MRPKHVTALTLPLLLAFTSCSSTDHDEAQDRADTDGAAAAVEAAEAAEEAEAPDPDEIAKMEHDLMVAQTKLEIARLELESSRVQQEQALAHERTKLALAEAELANFLEVEMPNRIAGEELSLQGAKDSAQDAEDELAQLEIMYSEQDLEEMTREYVISRGRRRAVRAAARIAIAERELAALREFEMPSKRTKLEMGVTQARESVEKAERSNAVAMMRKELALSEAEVAVERAARKLEKANEGASS